MRPVAVGKKLFSWREVLVLMDRDLLPEVRDSKSSCPGWEGRPQRVHVRGGRGRPQRVHVRGGRVDHKEFMSGGGRVDHNVTCSPPGPGSMHGSHVFLKGSPIAVNTVVRQ